MLAAGVTAGECRLTGDCKSGRDRSGKDKSGRQDPGGLVRDPGESLHQFKGTG